MKKRILLAAVSQIALVAASGADAADIQLKAAPRIAAPVYSWTGCYVGAHVGFGWGRHDVAASNSSFGPGDGASGSTSTNALDSGSGIFGGQLGCNYQFSGNWVVGLQGDFAGTSLGGEVADPWDRIIPGPFPGSIGVKTDWLASVTGRVGMTAWDNRALFYLKGGAGFTRNRFDFNRSSYCFYADGCRDLNPAETRVGWTVGTGAEWVLSPSLPNWTAFAEYNYYGFGRDGASYPVGFIGVDARNALASARQDIQTVKVGVNYKLFTP
ncbi:outer membrane protein [Bradyrhizobium betae]|uniref:outer membrane protein n=1 Tax=Bradyrhizobium betae TaxID=244734 RepID=UPI003D67E0E2